MYKYIRPAALSAKKRIKYSDPMYMSCRVYLPYIHKYMEYGEGKGAIEICFSVPWGGSRCYCWSCASVVLRKERLARACLRNQPIMNSLRFKISKPFGLS